jgi:hypothetical protein
MAEVSCRRCGGEVIQKSRSRLAVTGVLMLAAPGLGFVWPPLWLLAGVLVPAGGYLLAWASVGRALWCRSHKGFDGI